MNTTAKLAKVVFGSSRIETRNKGITFSGLVAPKSKMEIGYGSNYDDSNWYPVYLDTNGVISTNSGVITMELGYIVQNLYMDINRR